jgi:hypothetical protein
MANSITPTNIKVIASNGTQSGFDSVRRDVALLGREVESAGERFNAAFAPLKNQPKDLGLTRLIGEIDKFTSATKKRADEALTNTRAYQREAEGLRSLAASEKQLTDAIERRIEATVRGKRSRLSEGDKVLEARQLATANDLAAESALRLADAQKTAKKYEGDDSKLADAAREFARQQGKVASETDRRAAALQRLAQTEVKIQSGVADARRSSVGLSQVDIINPAFLRRFTQYVDALNQVRESEEKLLAARKLYEAKEPAADIGLRIAEQSLKSDLLSADRTRMQLGMTDGTVIAKDVKPQFHNFDDLIRQVKDGTISPEALRLFERYKVALDALDARSATLLPRFGKAVSGGGFDTDSSVREIQFLIESVKEYEREISKLGVSLEGLDFATSIKLNDPIGLDDQLQKVARLRREMLRLGARPEEYQDNFRNTTIISDPPTPFTRTDRFGNESLASSPSLSALKPLTPSEKLLADRREAEEKYAREQAKTLQDKAEADRIQQERHESVANQLEAIRRDRLKTEEREREIEKELLARKTLVLAATFPFQMDESGGYSFVGKESNEILELKKKQEQIAQSQKGIPYSDTSEGEKEAVFDDFRVKRIIKDVMDKMLVESRADKTDTPAMRTIREHQEYFKSLKASGEVATQDQLTEDDRIRQLVLSGQYAKIVGQAETEADRQDVIKTLTPSNARDVSRDLQDKRQKTIADRDAEQKRLAETQNNRQRADRIIGGRSFSSVGDYAKGGLDTVQGFFTGAFRSITSQLVGFSNQLFANLTARVVAYTFETGKQLVATALDAAKNYEDALVSFGVLTGSPERGKKLVDQLQKLAVETPYRSSELLDESKLLLSYGVEVDKIKNVLTQLGDVASGTGVEIGRLSLAYGQVIAKGRLQGTEIRQFTEAGVGIQDFVGAYNDLEGRNVRNTQFLKLVEDGQVSSKVVEYAFEKMTSAGGRFFGFMEERSQTVSGRISAFVESLELVAQKIGKSIFDNLGVRSGLDYLVKQLQSIDTNIADRFLGNIGGSIQKFARDLYAGSLAVMKDFSKRVVGDFDSTSFGDVLSRFANSVVPTLLDAGTTLALAFASLAQVTINVIRLLASALPNSSGGQGTDSPAGGIGSLIGGFLGGRGGLALGLGLAPLTGGSSLATMIGVRALMAGGGLLLGAAGGSAAGGAAGRRLVSGPSANDDPNDPLVKASKQIAELQQRLSDANSGETYKNATSGGLFSRLFGGPNTKELEAKVAEHDRKTAQIEDRFREDIIAMQGVGDSYENKQASTQLLADRFKAAKDDQDKTKRGLGLQLGLSKAFDEIMENKIVQDAINKNFTPYTGKQLRDYNTAVQLNRSYSELNGGQSPNIRMKDVSFTNDAIESVKTAVKGLGNSFLELGTNQIPQFRKHMEEVLALADKPKDKPADDFINKLRTVEFLSGPLANLLGVGIGPEKADLTAGRLAQDFIRNAPPQPEFKAAPLIRAGTQEAESALTQAINAFRSSDQNLDLKAAMDRQREATERNTQELGILAEQTRQLRQQQNQDQQRANGPAAVAGILVLPGK